MDSEPECRMSETTILTVQEEIAPEPPRSRISCKAVLKENLVLLLTLVGVVLGFAIGFGVRELNPSDDVLMWIGMPGELFLRMLTLMIVPLITGCVISGTSTLDPKSNGKIGMVALTWIVGTNLLACVFGVILSVTIKPGQGSRANDNTAVTSPFETQDIFADLLRNLIPNNIVELGFRSAVTHYSNKSQEVSYNLTNGSSVTEVVVTKIKSNGKADSINVLGLIFVCLIFGIATNRLGKKASIFVKFFSVLTESSLIIIKWFFCTSPVGVASLIARSVAGITDLQDSFSKLGLFVVVVVVGVLVFQLVILSVLLFVLTRRNPLYFHWTILRPYFLAFSSAVSAMAVPDIMYCCEVKNRIDKQVIRFVVPFALTLSANGSAIFIASSSIFIAQYIGRDLSAGDVFIITLLAAFSSLALPSVPSASLVTLVVILTAVNVPSSNIALLFAVEWFLDRLRTGCNAVSICYCTAVVHRFCKDEVVTPHTEDPDSLLKHDMDHLENGF